MDRQTRRNIKHDKFVDEMNSFASFAQQNMKQLIAGAVILAVVIAGILGFLVYRRGVERKAQAALAAAIDSYSSPLKTQAPDNPRARFDTADQRTEAAAKEFQDLVAKYGSSDAADVARLYLGEMAATRGEYDKARGMIEEFIKDHPEHVLATEARLSLINLKMSQGKVDDAIADIQKEMAEPNKTLPPDVLLAALANAYEISGQLQKAQETYQRIANEFPESPYSLEAQRKLAQG